MIWTDASLTGNGRGLNCYFKTDLTLDSAFPLDEETDVLVHANRSGAVLLVPVEEVDGYPFTFELPADLQRHEELREIAVDADVDGVSQDREPGLQSALEEDQRR